MTPFNPGDEVRLKSGGPIMTVASIEDGKAQCLWFEGTKPLEKEYPLVVLMRKDDIPPRVSMATIRSI